MNIMTKSFYTWCIENHRNDLLKFWDYKLNKISPKDVAFTSNKKYYFSCNNSNHHSEMKLISNITHNKNYKLICRQCNSFGQWCIDNNRQDILKRWDYENNMIDPFDVQKSYHKKYFFKCPRGIHKSELKNIGSFTRDSGNMICKQCNSFAQWGIDNICPEFIEKYWDFNKNIVDPWDISISFDKKIWIKYQNENYYDSYNILCSCFVRSLSSLGSLYPQVFKVWSDKNEKTPYEYAPHSNKYVWWKCENSKHDDYRRTINNANKYNFLCPNCIRGMNVSKLQNKVSIYLSDFHKYSVNHEYECTLVPVNPKTNHKLPFDNEVVDLKLIIEVNGIQHYKIKSYSTFWTSDLLTPKEQLRQRQLYDQYKKLVALSNGYFYLVIPYWSEKNDLYKKLIDNKISTILYDRVGVHG